VLLGLAVDQIYAILGISAKAAAGQAAELFPAWVQLIAAMVVVAISVKPTVEKLRSAIEKRAMPKPESKEKKDSLSEAAPDLTATIHHPSVQPCSGAA
jgi:hypothetical protein